MRVLHLLDRSALSRPCLLAMLADGLGRLGPTEQYVAVWGRAPELQTTADMGIDVHTVLPARRGLPMAGIGPLRRTVLRRNIDVVHAWSLTCLSLAAMACPHVPRLLTVAGPLGPRGVRWLRVLLAQGERRGSARTGLLPISNTLKRDLLAGGVSETAATVLRPGLDMGRVTTHRRIALRQGWGVDAASPARVIVLPADPPAAVNISLGVAIAAAAAASGPVSLVSAPGRCSRAVMRTLRSVCGLRLRVDASAARPWTVLPGADAVLALGDGGAGLSLLWAMAANMPIVGEATYAVGEIVEDRHSALLARPGDAASMAERLNQLWTDPQLAWRLCDTARHEAYSFFSRHRYCENIAAVYQQMHEGQPLDVPPPPVTGGLRFTGRA